MLLTVYLLHTARIEDMDPGLEQDAWNVPGEQQRLLQAGRWFYKGMNRLRDNTDKSGQLLYKLA